MCSATRWRRSRSRERSGDLGPRSPEALRNARGGQGHRPRSRCRRDLRIARHERRGQDHDDRDPRGLPHADRRRGVGARSRSRPADARVAGAGRARAAGERARSGVHGARDRRDVRPVLRTPARRRRHHHARRPGREPHEARRRAVGRPEAPGRRGARAHRRSRSRVPRRAHHGFRSRRRDATRGT